MGVGVGVGVIIKPEIQRKFDETMKHGRIIMFSAPCGFGKSTVANALLSGKNALTLCGDELEAGFSEKCAEYSFIIVDRFQLIRSETVREELCELIRVSPDKRFVILSRGSALGALAPFRLAGIMTVIDAKMLALDREETKKFLAGRGITLSEQDFSKLVSDCAGYPLALELTAQNMGGSDGYTDEVAEKTKRDLFLYYEDAVYRRFDLSVRRFLLEIAPFEAFDTELARMVSGDVRAGELIGRIERETSMLVYDKTDMIKIRDIFRQFLMWEMKHEFTTEQEKNLYDRAGIYYELRENYGAALDCYKKCGNQRKISEILIKNAELHPGMGHYEELSEYYHALPESEILASPALMQGMSMLAALENDYAQSERWYDEMRSFSEARKRSDGAAHEARVRLAWLDIALPQRDVTKLIETLPRLFMKTKAKPVAFPPFSVTSTLPSVMNGGKDFSEWSKSDDLLYVTMRRSVEAILGRDGVGLADVAITESKFEKGDDVTKRMISLMSGLSDIQRDGTPDIEFAAVGLLARYQTACGQEEDAKKSISALRSEFSEKEPRFLPNIDAMLCRLDMKTGNTDEVIAWYREKAPRDPVHFDVLRRYRYITQAMAEIAMGNNTSALLTLSPLEKYCDKCRRHIDRINVKILCAVAKSRLKDGTWAAELCEALDESRKYKFVMTVAEYGAAVLPLLEKCGFDTEDRFFKDVLAATRHQASNYPDFLSPGAMLSEPLTGTEFQVLRLMCADKSNAEIGETLNIKLATVKTHVSSILRKLDVNRRSEAKTAAERLRLTDVEQPYGKK